jgi:hypothetical protein
VLDPRGPLDPTQRIGNIRPRRPTNHPASNHPDVSFELTGDKLASHLLMLRGPWVGVESAARCEAPFGQLKAVLEVPGHRNAPPLRWGSRGTAVGLLQGGLIQLGFPLPRSTLAKSAPDAIFGTRRRSTRTESAARTRLG